MFAQKSEQNKTEYKSDSRNICFWIQSRGKKTKTKWKICWQIFLNIIFFVIDTFKTDCFYVSIDVSNLVTWANIVQRPPFKNLKKEQEQSYQGNVLKKLTYALRNSNYQYDDPVFQFYRKGKSKRFIKTGKIEFLFKNL